jgi:hypothetical protein
MLSLLVLIQKLSIPHNKNKAINPVKKDTIGVWGISRVIKNATIAILHHGKNKQALKLKRIIKRIDVVNFIFEDLLSLLAP